MMSTMSDAGVALWRARHRAHHRVGGEIIRAPSPGVSIGEGNNRFEPRKKPTRRSPLEYALRVQCCAQ